MSRTADLETRERRALRELEVLAGAEGRPLTLGEIGVLLGVSRETVRLAELAAIQKLRRALARTPGRAEGYGDVGRLAELLAGADLRGRRKVAPRP